MLDPVQQLDPRRRGEPRQQPMPGGYGWACGGVVAAGIVQVLAGAAMTAGMFIAFYVEGSPQDLNADGDLPPGFVPEALAAWMVALFAGTSLGGLVPVLGGLAAWRRRRYVLAVIGAIFAIGLQALYLCPIGPVFGVWLLVLLLRAEVREAFVDAAPRPAAEDDPGAWR